MQFMRLPARLLQSAFLFSVERTASYLTKSTLTSFEVSLSELLASLIFAVCFWTPTRLLMFYRLHIMMPIFPTNLEPRYQMQSRY